MRGKRRTRRVSLAQLTVLWYRYHVPNPMLLAIMSFVFVAYLVVGLAMPVLPLYVHNDLGLNNFIVGVAAGMPFAAALVSRIFAGRYADRRGPKTSVVAGLLMASTGGVLYLVALRAAGISGASITLLLLGRVLLGMADSFIITGALSWGLGLLGSQNTGKVMAWVGTAIYVAFAVGAPAGTALYAAAGFLAIAVATALVPLSALLVLAPLRSAPPAHHVAQASVRSVLRAVWQPGVALALSGAGFGAITAFIALLFAENQWAPAWPAFSALSVAFIIGRMCFGTVPDRIGGAKVACIFITVETAGLIFVWLAPSIGVAIAGVALAGLGYSLVYPALGVVAIQRAPAQSRGLAMGTFTAFADLSLGFSGPVLGLIATGARLNTVYLVSAGLVFCGAIAALILWRLPTNGRASSGNESISSRPREATTHGT